ncbi:hypothetical protein [Catenuloplanes japonicus]|uniref:hypothetical protein n=1 Tax=Catenuloplanes japonicus TaxID=33876 RepID=UPI000AFE6222|nr:hypothetical protein [Catenuloplanes japonicus]
MRNDNAMGPPPTDPKKCGHHRHKNNRGGWCGQWVTPGTTGCLRHAGVAPAEHAAKGQIRLQLNEWTLDGHDGASIDPRVEILRLIAFWKWRCNLYGSLIGQAYEAAERLQRAHAAEQIVLIDEQIEVDEQGRRQHEHPELQTARADLNRVFAQGGVTALVGHKYDADRGLVYAVDEGVRALTELERKAHEMVGKFCALAVSANVAQAKIDLAKQVGVLIQVVIVGVLSELGVQTAEERVWESIVRHIDLATAEPTMKGIAA